MAKPLDLGDVSIEDKIEKSGVLVFCSVFLFSIPERLNVNPEKGFSGTCFVSTEGLEFSSTGVITGALEKVSPPKDIGVPVLDLGVAKLGNKEEVGVGRIAAAVVLF